MRDGEADRALELYERHGRLHVGRNSDEVISRLLAGWHATDDPDGCLMIAHFRADVAELNGRARRHASSRSLGPEEPVAAAGRFAVGDRIVVKHKSSRLDVRNGERGVVEVLDLHAAARATAL
jgi:hypothetical protein